jgi:hypothetical protein
MTEDDAQHSLKFGTQRRAELGRMSLLEFLKKVGFDFMAMTTEAALIDAFCQTAIESKTRIEEDKGSPTARAIRRISRAAQSNSGSSSEQSRGRVLTRTST